MCSGKTGSGKSATAVRIVYAMWKNGMDVWSNTPLFFTDYKNGSGGENIIDNPEKFTIWEKYVLNNASILSAKLFKKERWVMQRGKINYFDTIDEVFHIKNAVILFDEGQTLFRNYDWEQVPRLFLYKLEQNRKHQLHLVTTAQRMKAVNINYRELIQNWHHFETIFVSELWEKFEKLCGFHWFTEYKMDSDLVTEQYMNMHDLLAPAIKDKESGRLLKPCGYTKKKWRFLFKFQKQLYDTFFDIGFQPLQHYKVFVGNEQVKLHLESGMTVKEAISKINYLKKLREI